MAERKQRDRGLPLLKQVAFSLLLWVATTAGAMRGLQHAESGLARVLLVAAGIGGFLPWVYVSAKAIFAEDEFNQRIHLVAIAVTFAVTGTASFAVDFLHRARFIPELPVTGLWMLMGVVWWISIMATARFYR